MTFWYRNYSTTPPCLVFRHRPLSRHSYELRYVKRLCNNHCKTLHVRIYRDFIFADNVDNNSFTKGETIIQKHQGPAQLLSCKLLKQQYRLLEFFGVKKKKIDTFGYISYSSRCNILTKF